MGIVESFSESIERVNVFLESDVDIDEGSNNHSTTFSTIIFTIGNALDNSSTEEEITECMDLIRKVWSKSPLSIERVINIATVILPYREFIPEDLYEQIKWVFTEEVQTVVKFSIDDVSVMSFLLAHDKQMLIDILKTCKKSWFVEHTVTLYGDQYPNGKKREKLPGLFISDKEELFQLIDETIHPNWTSKQKKTIKDVLAASYGGVQTPEVKSHKGLVVNETSNRKEKLLQLAFSYPLEKITTESKKDHKTPDFIVRGRGTNVPIMTVECNANTNANFIERCKEAIRHGDSKELGWRFYSSRYGIPENVIKVAALVVDFTPNIQYMSDDNIIQTVKQIRITTQMDCFILMMIDYVDYAVRTFVFNITGKKIPDVFIPNAIITNYQQY